MFQHRAHPLLRRALPFALAPQATLYDLDAQWHAGTPYTRTQSSQYEVLNSDSHDSSVSQLRTIGSESVARDCSVRTHKTRKEGAGTCVLLLLKLASASATVLPAIPNCSHRPPATTVPPDLNHTFSGHMTEEAMQLLSKVRFYRISAVAAAPQFIGIDSVLPI